MPYSTSNQGQGLTQAANAFAKIFVGDPAADQAYANQQIRNETEYLRQQQINESIISEGVRRKQMEAAAASSYAAAAAANARAEGTRSETSARQGLGDLFTNMQPSFDHDAGVQSARQDALADPNFRPTPEFAAPIDAAMATATPSYAGALDSAMPDILGQMMTGGVDPKMLSAAAALPGLEDDHIARLMLGSGNTLGKDEYVSIDDRNTNRMYELGDSERLVGGDGGIKTDIDPSYRDTNLAAAAKDYASAATGGGSSGKIPKIGEDEVKNMMLSALQAGGMNTNKQWASQALQNQPELYASMLQIIGDSWRTSGGNAAVVQAELSKFLQQVGLSGTKAGFDDPLTLPDLGNMLTQGQGLPNLQNVGNTGGWTIESVE